MVPSLEPFVSLLQICWSECPQTSHHPTTNTRIPEMELKVLQQRGNRKLWSEWKDATHSWVPRASTKALRCTQGAPTFVFDLHHRFEVAEVIGIAKLFFPKPQQHWNQSTSLVHSPWHRNPDKINDNFWLYFSGLLSLYKTELSVSSFSVPRF